MYYHYHTSYCTVPVYSAQLHVRMYRTGMYLDPITTCFSCCGEGEGLRPLRKVIRRGAVFCCGDE